jgi:hypothetical protein
VILSTAGISLTETGLLVKRLTAYRLQEHGIGSYKEQENSASSCQAKNPSEGLTRMKVAMEGGDAEEFVVVKKPL